MSLLLSICFFACSVVCWLHVHKIVQDKAVKGVSLIPTFVFMTTNIVEMVYFSQKMDKWSALGSASMLFSNAAWTVCVFYYMGQPRRDAFTLDLTASDIAALSGA